MNILNLKIGDRYASQPTFGGLAFHGKLERIRKDQVAYCRKVYADMKLQGSTLFWTFLWSLFMGVTAISIGFGAVFPSMNLIAKPFVCPNGKMDLTTQTYNPYPGSTVTTLTCYCINEN